MKLSTRGRRAAVTAVAGLLTLSLVAPAQAVDQTVEQQQATGKRPDPQRLPSVPGKDYVPEVAKGQPQAARASAAVAWPKAGTAEVAPGTRQALPVRLSSAGSGTPDRVRIDLKPTTGKDLRFTLQRSDGAKGTGTVRVAVDYKAFRDAYGADWATRLQITPAVRQAGNNTETGIVSADVPVDGTARTFAVTAGPSGSTGDYRATSLAPSGKWQVSNNGGGFTWSYPFRTPPVPGGLAPELAAGYASQGSDGRTVATNNQSSWLGEGWDLSAGSIERAYKQCSDDLDGNNGKTKTGDLCWETDNAVVAFGEQSGELVRENGVWHLKDDDGTKVERLTGTTNDDNDGEYWKITTTDGTQYYFGLNKLPGWSSGKLTTQSAWTVPVYGNDTGEPCRQDTFAASACRQAYRWNLDHVVDPHGNTMSYFYDVETNAYGQNLGATKAVYTRGGVLRRIEYGTRAGDAYATAPARVVFESADRCEAGQNCASHTATAWPDVPWDQDCSTATCPDKVSPTFWSTKRLAKVTTQVSTGGGNYRSVDQWDFAHSYPRPGDGTAPGLWLNSITHAGLAGDAITLPAVTFTPTLLPNRVDTPTDQLPALYKPRITTVTTESGGQVTIGYAQPDCTPTQLPTAPDSNGKRCYPVKWTLPPETEPRDNWFHKYVVFTTTEHDRAAGNKDLLTAYVYEGDAAWAYDDNPLVDPKYRTWSQWRGYGKVVVVKGDESQDPGIKRTATRYHYFRGMHGDKLAAGGTKTVDVVDTTGAATPDVEQYAGFLREQIVYNGVGGGEVQAEIHDPWSRLTATEGAEQAHQVEDVRVRTRTTIAGGGVRRTDVTTTFDQFGNETQVNDLGDIAVGTDDRCTTKTYVHNTAAMLVTLPSTEKTIGVACGTTPNLPADAISDTLTSYDGGTVDAAPVRGAVTRTEQAKSYSGGTPVYQTTSTATYDAYGRPLEQKDALERVSTTSYTEVNGLTVGVIKTNPKGHQSTDTIDPAWGVAVQQIDANQRVTSLKYDALGRLSKVWKPGRTEADQQTPHVAYEYGLRQTGGPSWVKTLTLKANGNQVASYTLYDGLLRERQTQQPSPAGGRILTDVEYDSRGLAVVKRAGYYNSQAAPGTTLFKPDPGKVPNATVIAYDGVGRPTSETYAKFNVAQWATTTTYGGDRVTVLPPEGGTLATTVSDARGQVTAKIQYQGRTTATPAETTRYDYTKRGDLARITDPAGNIWQYEYDVLGRKVRAVDPDKGAAALGYDDAGQLTSVTDARDRTVLTSYDALGRKIAARIGSPTSQPVAEWVYDTVYKGSLTSSTRRVGTAEYTRAVTEYDTAGRPTVSTVTIPAVEGKLAGTYTTTSRYADDGSIRSIRLPKLGDLPEESINNEYDALGLQEKVTGALPYVTATEYNGLGDVTQVELGGEARRLWRSSYYEDGTRRLLQVRTDREQAGGVRLDNLTYAYDQVGNVTRTTDEVSGSPADTQCYSYDHQRRVKAVWTATDNCAAAPSTSTVGGPAPYWQEYTYDVVGNRTKMVDKGLAGAADVTSTYNYPTAHELTSVTTGSVTGDYTYDNAGNLLTRPGPNGAEQALTWDDEGLLTSIGTTKYVYDADGTQLIRRDAGLTTLFVGGGEVTVTTTGVVKGTRYLDGIGTRTAAGFTWTIEDNHDTAVAGITEAGLTVSARRFDLFGNARTGTGSWTGGDRSFVGGSSNSETGLIRLGAREYDPALGRFISVDPVIDPQDPQQLNPYVYANNSPATFTDPDGLRFFGGGSRGWFNLGAIFKKVAKRITAIAKNLRKKPGPKDNLCKIVKCTVKGKPMVHNWLLDNMNTDTLNRIRRISKEAGIDPQLLLAMLIAESADKHESILEVPANPWAGSVGVANMQEQPFVAAAIQSKGKMDFSYADTFSVTDNREVYNSIKAAAYYIAFLQDRLEKTVGKPKYVTVPQAIRIGYNMGVGRVMTQYPGTKTTVHLNLGRDNMTKVAVLNRAPRGQHGDVVRRFAHEWDIAGNLLDAAG